ncbi:universal stress protein [Lederbergia citri]|uniref:Universal stress protein n=1 Tax=Lederbergia citri TaxID=2833580 RepID=A0A942TC64_9BACI|nr:universal stress protein [Lederbergia citri]MBS4194995.1 universal stress protein [Lederbergia citri]
MTLMYHNILVAVDGSKSAECAFKKAVQIAKRNNAKLTLIHVIDTRSFATIDAYNGTMSERAKTYAKELLEQYTQEAEAQQFTNFEGLVEYGSPKTVIPKQIAKKIKADLIICGATGLNAVERLLIGSVSEHIMRSAECDVLIVRTEEEKL